jgi:hypothetical protein
VWTGGRRQVAASAVFYAAGPRIAEVVVEQLAQAALNRISGRMQIRGYGDSLQDRGCGPAIL